MHPAISLLHEGKLRITLGLAVQCSPQDETDVIFHMKAYESRSVLLRSISPATMLRILDRQLCQGLQGILQDIVR